MGELLNFVFTPANTDDREPLSYEHFMKNVKGKPVGDKGYISKKLFERLFVDGIQLITKLKKNMTSDGGNGGSGKQGNLDVRWRKFNALH